MQDDSCIQSADMDLQNPPEHVVSELNKAIDKIDRDKRRDDDCDAQSEASTLDSGGHAPTPPVPPIKKPQ